MGDVSKRKEWLDEWEGLYCRRRTWAVLLLRYPSPRRPKPGLVRIPCLSVDDIKTLHSRLFDWWIGSFDGTEMAAIQQWWSVDRSSYIWPFNCASIIIKGEINWFQFFDKFSRDLCLCRHSVWVSCSMIRLNWREVFDFCDLRSGLYETPNFCSVDDSF
jgi:hypothetical protein